MSTINCHKSLFGSYEVFNLIFSHLPVIDRILPQLNHPGIPEQLYMLEDSYINFAGLPKL